MLPNALFDQHKHVGLDLDETLAETFPGFLSLAHSLGHLENCRTIEDFRHHDIYENPSHGISMQEVGSIWEQFGQMTGSPESIPLVENAREGVSLLRSMGKEISIVTARNDQVLWKKKRTLDWISFYFPEIDQSDVYFVNHYHEESRPKSQVCKEKGVTLLIDDHIENARDLAQAGLTTLLLEKPWNRDIVFEHPLVYRVKNWQEIIKSIPIYV